MWRWELSRGNDCVVPSGSSGVQAGSAFYDIDDDQVCGVMKDPCGLHRSALWVAPSC